MRPSSRPLPLFTLSQDALYIGETTFFTAYRRPTLTVIPAWPSLLPSLLPLIIGPLFVIYNLSSKRRGAGRRGTAQTDADGRATDGSRRAEKGRSCRRNDTPNADRPTDNIGIGGLAWRAFVARAAGPTGGERGKRGRDERASQRAVAGRKGEVPSLSVSRRPRASAV